MFAERGDQRFVKSALDERVCLRAERRGFLPPKRYSIGRTLMNGWWNLLWNLDKNPGDHISSLADIPM